MDCWNFNLLLVSKKREEEVWYHKKHVHAGDENGSTGNKGKYVMKMLTEMGIGSGTRFIQNSFYLISVINFNPTANMYPSHSHIKNTHLTRYSKLFCYILPIVVTSHYATLALFYFWLQLPLYFHYFCHSPCGYCTQGWIRWGMHHVYHSFLFALVLIGKTLQICNGMTTHSAFVLAMGKMPTYTTVAFRQGKLGYHHNNHKFIIVNASSDSMYKPRLGLAVVGG